MYEFKILTLCSNTKEPKGCILVSKLSFQEKLLRFESRQIMFHNFRMKI